MSPSRLLLAALAGPTLVVPLLLAACVREADLRDEPDAEAIDTPQDLDAGEIPVLDSGLETDAFAPCSAREQGDCVGTNDFLCGFTTWVNKLAAACQVSTGCVTNGFLRVEMAGGCAVSIAMDQPNDAMVACLLAELGTKQCPCDEASASYFFGESNTGTCSP